MKDVFNKMVFDPLIAFLKDLKTFIPNLISSIIILFVGLLAAYLSKLLVVRLLGLFNAERFFQKMGLTDTLKKAGLKDTPSMVIGRAIYWIVLFVFMIIALYALKVPAVDAFLGRLLLYLPNLFVALIIVIVGSGIGNFLSRAVLVGAVNAGLQHARWLSRGVKLSIIVFVITMALEQLGIGKETVLTAFTLLFGGAVFALALAFGLAAKDFVQDYLRKTLGSDQEKEEPDELKHL
ncbi:MAG: hypothetical protein D6778_00330 [Nitrospirae bacterium]|nr:MAG: hypothetical protein D6778_00330 [Nitrospirota bacterium]